MLTRLMVFGVVLVPGCAASAGDPEAIDAFVEPFVAMAMFDGTIVVDIGGEIVYERSFGLAHHELNLPHDDATRFRIASVSKTVTDAAFARLVAQERLDLDAPLSDFLPDLWPAETIPIRRLLDHTAGIPHTNDQPWSEKSLSIDEIVERLSRLPLDFAPGTGRRYSNGGYAVAARVLEIVGGGTFAEALRATVFDPLGLADTGHIDDTRAVIPHLATGYEPGRVPGARRHARFYPVETRPGGGSLYSTPRDMLRFMRAVFRDDFVPATLRRDVLGADDGAFLTQGRSPGCVAKAYYDPAGDIIVISLSNNYAVPADWAAAIASLALGSTDVSPWPDLRRSSSAAVSMDDPRLGRYTSSRGGTEMVIERSTQGVMTIRAIGDDSITALIPLDGGPFLMPLYFQLCTQDPESRVITCAILSGDSRYTSVLTPIAADSD